MALASCLIAPGAALTVDLRRQTVRDVEGAEHEFPVHPLRKRCLLNGLDDVSLTKQFGTEMESFERAYRCSFPWLVVSDGGKIAIRS